MKETWYCAECGSHEVHHDAVVQWNAETEEFDIVAVLDGTWCNKCSEQFGNEGAPTFGVPPEGASDADA